MKQSAAQKTSKSGAQPSAGPNGVAIAPPAYAIESLDGGLMEAAPEREPSSGAPLQMKAASSAEGDDAGARPQNKTGLPDALKTGVESLSGLALDDVRVHYNSSRPAQLQAFAYAQGTDIHIGPGQERHLPHEAWHVVQQKQGRVQATKQLKGARINDNSSLEKEADVMGASAIHASGIGAKPGRFQLETNAPAGQPAHPGPIQRKKNHAAKFIETNGLGIEAESDAITTYVNDKSNPIHLRRGLLNAWNRGQIFIHRIATPSDLEASSTTVTMMEDLGGWDSGEEDDWDLEKVKPTLETDKMDLERVTTSDKTDVTEMSFFDAIRYGRQVVKRDAYDQIPITTSLGGHFFEYDNPGTKDIYATPLEEVPTKDTGSKSKKGKKTGRKYKRSGTSSDYNWKSLARRLDERRYKNSKLQMTQMLQFFLRKNKVWLDSAISEALAAIGSDLMKGSSGGRFFLRKALRQIQASKKKDLAFADLFSGKSPIYEPAAVGGRALVSSTHAQFQLEANTLLMVNNCLINAIALASPLGRRANLGELIRIREQLQNYGEMLVASPAIVQLIREVLGIQNPIQVVYAFPTPAENFPGVGALLTIYHVNGNHFTHIAPVFGGSGKKKPKKNIK